MSQFLSEIKHVASETQQFAESKLEVIRLDSIDKTVNATSKIASWLIIGVIGFLAICVLSTVAGILLSEWLQSYAAGFSIVGGFYFLTFIILFFFKDTLISKPIRNQLLENFLD